MSQHWVVQDGDGAATDAMGLYSLLLSLLEDKVTPRLSPAQLDNLRRIVATAPPSTVLFIMLKLVDLQPQFHVHKQSVLDEVWAFAAATDVAAQPALSLNLADTAAEQNVAGGVSASSSPSTLNEPLPRAMKTLQEEEQQATGRGSDSASSNSMSKSQARKKRKQAAKGRTAAGEAVELPSTAAPAASVGLVQPAEGKHVEVWPTQADLTLLTYVVVLV